MSNAWTCAFLVVLPVVHSLRVDRLNDPKSCAKDWTEFGRGPLAGMTSVSNSSFNPETLQLDRHVYVHPELKFAFCTIPKVGCSSWDTIFWKMFLNDRSYQAWTRPDHYFIGSISQKNAGSHAIHALFSDPSATRAVFVRDPLARFASAFLSKCFRQKCSNPSCVFRSTAQKGKPITFRQAVEGMLMQNPSNINKHWESQSDFCGFQHNVTHFNVIGLMTPQTYGKDAGCLMESSNLSRFNVQGPHDLRPFWTEIPINHNHGGTMTEADVLKRLFTKDQARNLMAHFSRDYEVFKIPEPGWVTSATGEWYDALPNGCQEEAVEHFGRSPGYGSDEYDIDDLVELASVTGYLLPRHMASSRGVAVN